MPDRRRTMPERHSFQRFAARNPAPPPDRTDETAITVKIIRPVAANFRSLVQHDPSAWMDFVL
jgi:hypothetical protein